VVFYSQFKSKVVNDDIPTVSHTYGCRFSERSSTEGGGEILTHTRCSGGIGYLRSGKWIRDEKFMSERGECVCVFPLVTEFSFYLCNKQKLSGSGLWEVRFNVKHRKLLN
jgi:hypothetical protein